MTGAVDTATTRDAGIQPPVEAASAAAPTGRGPDAPAPGDEQTLHDPLWQARSERNEYLDTLQRVQAEYDNYRRRARREQAEQHDRGGQALAEKLLPVLDSFDAARAHAPDVLAPLHSALTTRCAAPGWSGSTRRVSRSIPRSRTPSSSCPGRTSDRPPRTVPGRRRVPRRWSWTRCCVRATAGAAGWFGRRWCGSAASDSRARSRREGR